jgi:hypothetical protein
MKSELVITLEAAKALGLTIPQSLLLHTVGGRQGIRRSWRSFPVAPLCLPCRHLGTPFLGRPQHAPIVQE